MSLKNKRSRLKKRRIGLQKRKMAAISARNVALYRRKFNLFVFQDEMGFSNTLGSRKNHKRMLKQRCGILAAVFFNLKPEILPH
jgi:hypothetical protein